MATINKYDVDEASAYVQREIEKDGDAALAYSIRGYLCKRLDERKTTAIRDTVLRACRATVPWKDIWQIAKEARSIGDWNGKMYKAIYRAEHTPATQKQLEYMEALGIKYVGNINKAAARKMLDKALKNPRRTLS